MSVVVKWRGEGEQRMMGGVTVDSGRGVCMLRGVEGGGVTEDVGRWENGGVVRNVDGDNRRWGVILVLYCVREYSVVLHSLW